MECQYWRVGSCRKYTTWSDSQQRSTGEPTEVPRYKALLAMTLSFSNSKKVLTKAPILPRLETAVGKSSRRIAIKNDALPPCCQPLISTALIRRQHPRKLRRKLLFRPKRRFLTSPLSMAAQERVALLLYKLRAESNIPAAFLLNRVIAAFLDMEPTSETCPIVQLKLFLVLLWKKCQMRPQPSVKYLTCRVEHDHITWVHEALSPIITKL